MGLRPVAVVGAALALTLAGCGGGTARSRPVTPSEWKLVIRDSYDGKIDHRYRCAAVQAAYAHIPHDLLYSRIPDLLLAVEKAVC